MNLSVGVHKDLLFWTLYQGMALAVPWNRRKVRVESRMGAGTDASGRRPVSHPRSSNRTCGFAASGFPSDFIAGSRARAPKLIPQPEHTQLAVNPLRRKLTGALRLHLVSLPQEMPHAVFYILVHHLE